MSARPDSPPAWTTVDALAEANEPPHEYALWLAQSADVNEDYLFAEAKVRFAAREGDRLVAPDDLEVAGHADGVVLSSKRLGGSLVVRSLSERAARRMCGWFDGQPTYGELRARAGRDRSEFDALVQATLGRVLFAPEAVTELEQRVSGTELVRFVGTPYEVERAYWANMGDVRSSAALALTNVHDTESFVRALRRLHVLTLLGSSLHSFYRPASRVSAQQVQPGALYTTPVQCQDTERGTLLISGPRVGVPFVGGKNYHALVYAHDPEALEATRSIYDANGLAWGRVVEGRAASEPENRAWFLPPRPLGERHFESLFSAYTEAAHALQDPAALLRSLARFHFRFVRLHPFRCANQSLCMNLVNRILLEATGKTMPHSLLDQFALRLSEQSYEVVFERAVAHTAGGGAPSARWAELRRQKADVYSLIARLQNAATPSEARALAAASPAAAKAALIAS